MISSQPLFPTNTFTSEFLNKLLTGINAWFFATRTVENIIVLKICIHEENCH